MTEDINKHTPEEPTMNPPAKSMHDLKLNEYMKQGALEILRVPGGWLYSWAWGKDNQLKGATMQFIPYSDEFKTPNKEDEGETTG